jgi:uncharacterized protein (TIGR02001 family)
VNAPFTEKGSIRGNKSLLPISRNLAHVALCLAAMLSAASSHSDEEMSALLRLTSNYEYRGYSLSDNHAAVQAKIDIAWTNGFFLGSWVSSADFGGADLVANPYLGKSFTLSPDWQIAALVAGHVFDQKIKDYYADYYGYEHVNKYNANYGDAALRLDYRDLASVQVNLSPDYYGSGATVLAYEAELRYPLSDIFEVSGGLGYQTSRNALNQDDLYADVGIAWFVSPRVTLDLRYHDQHSVNERHYGQASNDSLSDYRLDTPVIFSVSLGL